MNSPSVCISQAGRQVRSPCFLCISPALNTVQPMNVWRSCQYKHRQSNVRLPRGNIGVCVLPSWRYPRRCTGLFLGPFRVDVEFKTRVTQQMLTLVRCNSSLQPLQPSTKRQYQSMALQFGKREASIWIRGLDTWSGALPRQ